jgi:hypothetical protein
MMCDHGPGPTGTIVLFILSIAAICAVGFFLSAFEEAREFDRMEQRG